MRKTCAMAPKRLRREEYNVISLPVDTVYFNSYNPYLLMLWIIGAAIVFAVISVLVWKLNERKYESTGS